MTTNAASEPTSTSARRQERTPWLVTLAIAAAFGVVIGIQGFQDFEQLEREAEGTAVHAAELLHENATRALGEIVLTLEDLRLALESEAPGPVAAQTTVLRERFFSKLVHLAQVEALVVLDAAGRVTGVSSLNPDFRVGSDLQSWFASHRAESSAGLTMGLVRQVQDNTWRVVMTRKVATASGQARAIVAAVIGAGYFQDLVRGQSFVGKGGIEFVLGLTGGETLLAHSARGTDAPVRSSDLIVPALPNGPAGTFETVLAGRTWIASYRRLPNQQIAVGALLDKATIRDEWLTRRLPTVLMTTIFLMLLVMFTAFATRHMRRRHAAETSLRASEERFRDVAEAASDWIWETGPDARFSFVSRRAETVFGIERGLLIGMPVQSLFSGARNGDGDPAQLERIARREPFRDAIGQIALPTGEIKHVKLSAKPLWNAENAFAGYRGTGTDITAEVEASRGAEQARARLVDAVESLSQGFALFDSNDGLVLCNSRFRELHGGIADKVAAGCAFTDLVAAQADIELASLPSDERKAWTAGRLDAHAQSHHGFEYRCGDKWLLVTERRTHDGGTVCVETDITELKQRESELSRLAGQNQKLAAAVGAATSGIVITDPKAPDNPIIFVNAAFSALTGYPADAVIGQNMRVLQGPDTDPQRIAAIGRAMADGTAIITDVLSYRKDGTTFWNELNLSPVRDAGGSLTYFIAIMTDVTYRKEVERALLAAKTAAEISNRAKTEFLANMSHELRTPLNAIIGFSEVMQGEMFGPIGQKQYRGYIGDIHKSGQHLLEIINDILDMSKIESGKMEPRDEVVDLGDVVSSCLTLTAPRAQEMQQDVRVDLPRRPPHLSGDSHMIKRILLNLLSNAVKFTPRGGKIDVRVTPDRSGGLNLSVSDTGIGIAAEDVEKVWLPFGQVENPMQRTYHGTGLGLPLVKSMAELHQATVDMQSVLGAGTTVAVHFPRERIIRAA